MPFVVVVARSLANAPNAVLLPSARRRRRGEQHSSAACSFRSRAHTRRALSALTEAALPAAADGVVAAAAAAQCLFSSPLFSPLLVPRAVPHSSWLHRSKITTTTTNASANANATLLRATGQ